jgi:hypothetical protein
MLLYCGALLHISLLYECVAGKLDNTINSSSKSELGENQDRLLRLAYLKVLVCFNANHTLKHPSRPTFERMLWQIGRPLRSDSKKQFCPRQPPFQTPWFHESCRGDWQQFLAFEIYHAPKFDKFQSWRDIWCANVQSCFRVYRPSGWVRHWPCQRHACCKCKEMSCDPLLLGCWTTDKSQVPCRQ